MGQTDRRSRAHPLKEGLTLLSLDSQLLAQDRALKKADKLKMDQVKHSGDRAGKHVQPEHSTVPPRVQAPGTQRTTESCQGCTLKRNYTGHETQYPVTNHNGREYEKEYMCAAESLCCTGEINNTVNQLYFNEIKKKRITHPRTPEYLTSNYLNTPQLPLSTPSSSYLFPEE